MKISNYLIIKKLEVKDCYIVLNGLSGSIDYLSNQLGEKLSQGILEGITVTNKDYLEERGYIIKEDFDEKLQLRKIADIIHNKNLNKYRLSIAPTMSCNFACPYCFENSESEDSSTLDLSDIDELFNAVDNASLPFSQDVFLFGGEPLMKKNKELISYIVKHCQKRGMHNRKNWLFSDTAKGAVASAAVYSIVEIAKANNLNIYTYLNYLLLYMPDLDAHNNRESLEELMPWSKRVQAECKK